MATTMPACLQALPIARVDADGTVTACSSHERMIWGQGDGSGLKAVDSAVGRVGQLTCWEHYNPLARYALMADGEQIHAAMCIL
jgi:nitrilase